MKKPLLYKFFEGVASYKEEKEIKDWMEASSENERLFYEERKLYDAMILLADKKNIKENSHTRRFSLRKVVIESIKIAAIAFIVIGFSHLYQQKKTDIDLVAMQTITVPAGQRTNITLSDGTKIWLNSRSVFQFPTSFNKDERRVFLDGEAYMEVHKDENKRFIVATDKGEVEVLGTSFNIDSYADSHIFEISLITGKLNVRTKANPNHIVQLTPNMRATLREGNLLVDDIMDYTQFDWKEGLISFRNMTFAQIMKKFEKCYGIEIIIENEQFIDLTYSGKFRQTDGIDYALRVLQKNIPINYEKDEENYTIRIK